jgi:hypothetical protein
MAIKVKGEVITVKEIAAVTGKPTPRKVGGKATATTDFSAMGHQCAKDMLDSSNSVLKTWAKVLNIAKEEKQINAFRSGYVVECKAAGSASALVRGSECNRFFSFAISNATQAIEMCQSMGYHKLLASLPKVTKAGKPKQSTDKAPQKTKSASKALESVSEDLELVKETDLLTILNDLLTKMETSGDEYLNGLSNVLSMAWEGYNATGKSDTGKSVKAA